MANTSSENFRNWLELRFYSWSGMRSKASTHRDYIFHFNFIYHFLYILQYQLVYQLMYKDSL